MGKEVVYSKAAANPLPAGSKCWLCGGKAVTGLPKKEIIKNTFTDHSLSKSPHSDYVCEACCWALSERSLRNYSIFADERGIQHPSRSKIKDIILDLHTIPFLLCIAVSGQKWLHFKTPVNYSLQSPVVLLEETPIRLDLGLFREIIQKTEHMYNLGFSKDSILSGNYNISQMMKIGLKIVEAAEQDLQNLRKKGRQFELAVFLSQKEGEECTTDLTQETNTLV
jgi:hypothetical protein